MRVESAEQTRDSSVGRRTCQSKIASKSYFAYNPCIFFFFFNVLKDLPWRRTQTHCGTMFSSNRDGGRFWNVSAGFATSGTTQPRCVHQELHHLNKRMEEGRKEPEERSVPRKIKHWRDAAHIYTVNHWVEKAKKKICCEKVWGLRPNNDMGPSSMRSITHQYDHVV